ncbi:MAG TPA: amino acid permease [archaeon]|nr:amino acid permease [archaeon]
MALKLKRTLSLFEATIYGVGIILGAGIYALIGEAAGSAGNALWLSFVIGAAISALTGLSYAELSAMYPKAAAEYIYVKKASASKFLAFIIGWLLIFTGVLSAATVALGFSGYFNKILNPEQVLVPTFNLIIVAMVLIAILTFINFWGIKESSKMNVVFTVVEISGLLLIIALAFMSGSIGSVNYLEMPNGFGGIIAASILVFFAYIGFEEIVNIAEETKKPKKFIPRAIVAAIIITTILYILVAISTVSLADWKILGDVENPLALAASKSSLGDSAALIMSFIALFATTNTVLIILVVTSRMIYGIARDKALPHFLSVLHPSRNTPTYAVIAMMFLSMIFLFFGKIETIASITSLGAFITFAAINLSLVWLRYTKPNLNRPFRVPLNVGKFPILSFLGAIFCVFMIYQFKPIEMSVGVIILSVGAIVYHVRKSKMI